MPEQNPADRNRWRNWTYSEAVALGAYGDQQAHVTAMDALVPDEIAAPIPASRSDQPPAVPSDIPRRP